MQEVTGHIRLIGTDPDYPVSILAVHYSGDVVKEDVCSLNLVLDPVLSHRAKQEKKRGTGAVRNT